jgi:hypothetical protein
MDGWMYGWMWSCWNFALWETGTLSPDWVADNHHISDMKNEISLLSLHIISCLLEGIKGMRTSASWEGLAVRWGWVDNWDYIA